MYLDLKSSRNNIKIGRATADAVEKFLYFKNRKQFEPSLA